MNKKTIVIIAKLIPVISVVISYIMILGPVDASKIQGWTAVTVLLAFLGFVFFFIGRRFAREDRTVRILGILDILSTVAIIALYALAIVSIAL